MYASFARMSILSVAVTMVTMPLPGRAATPETEARPLVKRIASMKEPAQLPLLLTNETAAGMGVLFGAMLGMTGACADAMSGAVEGMTGAMGNAMGSATGDPDADPMGDAIGDGIVGENRKPVRVTRKPSPAAGFAAITTDVERVFRKHGVPSDNSSKSLTPKQKARIAARLEDGAGRLHMPEAAQILDGKGRSLPDDHTPKGEHR